MLELLSTPCQLSTLVIILGILICTVVLGAIALSNFYLQKVKLINFLKGLLNKDKIPQCDKNELKGIEEQRYVGLLSPKGLSKLFIHLSKVLFNTGEQSSTNEPIEAEHSNRELQNCDFIFVKSQRKWIKLRFDDIISIQSSKLKRNYLTVNTRCFCINIRGPLKEVLDLLPASQFIMIHKSVLINIKYIKSINQDFGFLHLEHHDQNFSIGPQFRPHLQLTLHNYMGHHKFHVDQVKDALPPKA